MTNQSGVGRSLITPAQLAAVHRRVDELTEPFGTFRVCPHRPQDGCGCRKPEPGLIRAAAHDLGVDVADCVVIGDIAADVAAARAAGARGIVVPTAATSKDELAGLPAAATLTEAVAALLAGRMPPSWPPVAPEPPPPAARRITARRREPSVKQFAGEGQKRW